nr:hypothetical protein [Tanacetum cinerariifolium]
MDTKDSLSSCSNSKEQEIKQLQMQTKTSKENSLNKLNTLQSTIQHLSSSNYSMYNKFRDAFQRLFEADERTFKTVLSRNVQNLERQLNIETLHEKDSNSDLCMINVQFEPLMHSKLLEPSNYNSYDLETRRDFKEYNQMEAQTFKETINQHMNSIEKSLDAILEDNTKKHCMVSLRKLHSHLKRLSQNDLQRSRTENGFKRAVVTIFGQDLETFTDTMFLNVERLEKQLDKEDFQELGSMAAFNVRETQFRMFITLWIYLDDEYVAMIGSYFIQFTQHAILEFCDTLIQHLESVKKSIDERVQHKRDVTESKEQDTCSRSWNNAHADDADIRPIYDEEPMTEVQTTAKINVFAIGQQHTEQPEFNNEGEVDQNAKE